MDIYQGLKNRRSIRKFKQTPLSKEQLRSYVDAARMAPSAANMQPLKYIAVNSKEMGDRLFPLLKWAGYLAPKYNPKELERPTAYIVVCADMNIRKNGYEADMGAAVENIILSALEDGVGSCWIVSVERNKLRDLLRVSENLEILCVVALGYPDESPIAVEMKNQDVKYYLENGRLNVPKRSLDDVLVEII